MHDAQRTIERFYRASELCILGPERLRLRIGIDENQTLPALTAQGKKTVITRIEIARRAKIACRCEPPIEHVAPAMIAAGETPRADALAVRRERAGAMTADIVVSLERVLVPDDKNWKAGDGRREHRARLCKLALVTNKEPGSREDRLSLSRVKRGIAIERRIERDRGIRMAGLHSVRSHFCDGVEPLP